LSTSIDDRQRPAESVAGFLAALSMTASLLAVVYRPVRLAPFAILLGLIAAGLGGRYARLAAVAVVVATLGWLIGMTVAVLTSHPLY
jgi:hypothetical protein